MIAVIFEVLPADGRRQDYLDLAADLKEELQWMDGFISVERFESLTEPGKLLSLSFWRDEAAVAAWRTYGKHRAAQAKGRAGIFADYHLRIASVSRDYGMSDREEAPADSRLELEI
ncbi:MAG: antibiotic biosynthesis monooxygenase [Pseudomonadota bacterium]